MVAGARSLRVWEFCDSAEALAWGVIFCSKEEREKKPADAAVGAKIPTDELVVRSM